MTATTTLKTVLKKTMQLRTKRNYAALIIVNLPMVNLAIVANLLVILQVVLVIKAVIKAVVIKSSLLRRMLTAVNLKIV